MLLHHAAAFILFACVHKVVEFKLCLNSNRFVLLGNRIEIGRKTSPTATQCPAQHPIQSGPFNPAQAGPAFLPRAQPSSPPSAQSAPPRDPLSPPRTGLLPQRTPPLHCARAPPAQPAPRSARVAVRSPQRTRAPPSADPWAPLASFTPPAAEQPRRDPRPRSRRDYHPKCARQGAPPPYK